MFLGIPSGSNEITVPQGNKEVDSGAVETASSIGPNYWIVEYSIDLSAFDLVPEVGESIQLNIGGRDNYNNDWKAWIGAQGANWQIFNAGKIVWGE